MVTVGTAGMSMDHPTMHHGVGGHTGPQGRMMHHDRYITGSDVIPPDTPRTKEARWRARKAEARWDTDAHQIRYYHAEEWKKMSEKIKADEEPHKRSRCRRAKREQRRLCKEDLRDHRRLFMNKMVKADRSELRRTSDHYLHLSIRPKWFRRVLKKGKPPSWPKTEDRLANKPPPSDTIIRPPSRMSGPPTPAPWLPVNPAKRRLAPRSITPFTRYMTPIPINVRKDFDGIPLTIPNNSNIKKMRTASTPRPTRSQIGSSADDSPGGTRNSVLSNDVTHDSSSRSDRLNPTPKHDNDCLPP